MSTRTIAARWMARRPRMALPARANARTAAPTHRRGAVLAVGVTREELSELAGPAARLAKARGARLVLLFARGRRSGRRRGAGLWLTALASEHGAQVRVTQRRLNRRLALRGAIDGVRPELIVAAVGSRQVRDLAAMPRVETVLVHRTPGGEGVKRILAVLEGAPGRDRLTLASAEGMAASEGAEVVLLSVVPPHTSESERDAIRAHTEASLPQAPDGVRRTVRLVQGRSSEAAILSTLRRGRFDLLVTGLPRGGVLPWADRAVPERLLERSPVPVLLASRPVPSLSSRLSAVLGVLYRLLPSLSDTERVQTYSSLRRSARGGPDFTFMIVLSTAIAGLGLRLDSATVVIGAMLVAPLMTPIVGVGLGVAEGDGRLVRISAVSVVRGSLTVFAVGLVIGLTLPPGSLTGEMLARTHPAPLDLIVALASGAAGAYAFCRKSAASALPGVAIAVSLVPPLTTSGIAFAAREEQAATGASLLFLLNLSAVSFASSVVFLWIGFRPELSRLGRLRLFARGLSGLAALLVAVSLPVGWIAWYAGSGPTLDEEVGEALTAAVADLPGVELRAFEVAETDGDLAVQAELGAPATLDGTSALEVQRSLADALERPVELALDVIPTTRLHAGGDVPFPEP